MPHHVVPPHMVTTVCLRVIDQVVVAVVAVMVPQAMMEMVQSSSPAVMVVRQSHAGIMPGSVSMLHYAATPHPLPDQAMRPVMMTIVMMHRWP